MALDPNKLSRNELVGLLNSTALGESITRSRLNREMNRAGRRWHDPASPRLRRAGGRNIRLLDYLRWLVREVERPAKLRETKSHPGGSCYDRFALAMPALAGRSIEAT